MKKIFFLLVAQLAFSSLFAQYGIYNNTQVVVTADTYLVIDGSMPYTNASTGKTTISGAMKIDSDMSNTAGNDGIVINNGGVLLHNFDGLNATVKQEIKANAWHLISSPVAPIDFESQFTGAYVYEYLENSTDQATAWLNITTGTMQTDRGYLVQNKESDRTISFEGVLNNGNMVYQLGFTDETKGYNLIGNPYACAIDWSAVSAQNTTGSFYVWSQTEGKYGTVSGDGETLFVTTDIIHANQGFIVKATSADDFIIGNAAKTLDLMVPFYKSTRADLLRFRLSGENLVDETVIYFKESATDNYDQGIDADKFFASATNLYSLTGEGTPLAINATSTKVKTVSLNFASETDGNYTLRVNEYTFTNDIIYIEDKLTGNVQMLEANAEYTFSHKSENVADRFVLHFNSTPMAIDSLNEISDIKIFAAEGKLNVLNAKEATITVFDVLGKRIYSAKAKTNAKQIELPKNAIYIVKTTKNNQITTQKIINK